MEQINFRFENMYYEKLWNEMYKLVKAYYNTYGHSNVPRAFRTKDGITSDIDGVTLGEWCNNQRAKFKNGKLTADRVKKLEQINFRFVDLHELDWQEKYKLAEIYFNHYGHSNMPYDFKTIDGINYDERGTALGRWCALQRNCFREEKLSEDRIKKLEKINFRFEILDLESLRIDLWQEKYKLAEIYFNHYGHSNIPFEFKTIDGINYDENGVDLGAWCATQRNCFREEKLSEARIKKLEKINFRFEIINLESLRIDLWQEKYKLAEIYFNYYGHSDIPYDFKTIDGINYDENGVDLGVWCNNQRTRFKVGKISDDRIKKMEQIEFRFKTKKETKKEKIELCNTYNIDFIKYKILDRMSYQELCAKIMFLLDSNFPLEVDGKLHPIFTMCNENMMINYGISKEELITNYYINRKVRR